MTFTVEQHGRYEIRSVPISGRWGANAFRRKARVTSATADSREEAADLVKAVLGRIEAVNRSERDAEGAPSAAAYRDAFIAVLA